MGRVTTILGIWFAGYALGFIGYLTIPALGQWLAAVLPNILLIETVAGALISGLISSVLVTLLVMLWAKFSR